MTRGIETKSSHIMRVNRKTDALLHELSYLGQPELVSHVCATGDRRCVTQLEVHSLTSRVNPT